MEENKNIFDDHLKDALRDLSGGVNPGDWERIASALDQLDAADSSFDQSLKASASEIEGTVSEQDWTNIESSLVRRRRRIIAWWWSMAGVLILAAGVWFFTGEDDVQPAKELVVDEQVNMESSEPILSTDARTEREVVAEKEVIDSRQTESPEKVVSELSETPENDISSSGDTKGDINGIKNIETRPEVSTRGEELVRATPPFMTIFPGIRYPLDITEREYNIPEGPENVSDRESLEKQPVISYKEPATWEFGVRATPNLGLLRSVANPAREGMINREFFDIANKSESFASGYTFGVNALRYVGSRYYVASGFQFSQKVERVKYHYDILYRVSIDETLQVIDGYELLPPIQRERVDYDGINTFNFAEFPIKFGTIVPLGAHSKWELRGEAGLSMLVLLNASGKKPDQTHLQLFDISSYSELKRMAMGMEVKGGLYHKGIGNFRFGFEPYYAMGLSSLYTDNSPTKLRPYNYGLNLTANYILFKK